MKRGMLTVLFAFVMLNSFSQTLTFNDLQHLLSEKNEDKYLRSKGFNVLSSQTTSGHTATYYVVHDHSPQMEIVLTGVGVTKRNGIFLNEAAYMAKYIPYINSLTQQIKAAGFKFVKQTPRPGSDEYRFEKDNLFVLVIRQHGRKAFNQVDIRYKSF